MANPSWTIVRRRRPLVYSTGLTTPVFTWVQSNGASSGAASSLSATFANPVKAGDLVVVLTGCYQAQASTVSVTDNYGNTYLNANHANFSLGGGTNEVLDIWYSVVATGGSSFQVTMTPSSPELINLGIAEFAFNGSPLSVVSTNAGTGNSATPSSGNLFIRGSDLVVGSTAWAVAAGNASSPGSGFSSIFANNAVTGTVVGFATEYQTGVTGNPTSATFGLGGSVGWFSAGVAFNLVGQQVGLVGRGITVTSSRRPRSGRVWAARILPPVGTIGTPLEGPFVAIRRALRPGRAIVGRFPPTISATPLAGLFVASKRASRSGRASVGRFPPTMSATPLAGLFVASKRASRPGRVSVGRFPPTISATPLAGLFVASKRASRSGRASVGRFPPTMSATPLAGLFVASKRASRPGRVSVGRFPPTISATPLAGLFVASKRASRSGRASVGRFPPTMSATPLAGLFVASKRASRPGRVSVGRFAPTMPVSPLRGLMVVGRRAVRRGEARPPRGLPCSSPILRSLKVVGPRSVRRGRVWLPNFPPAPGTQVLVPLKVIGGSSRRRGIARISDGFGLFAPGLTPYSCLRPITGRPGGRLGRLGYGARWLPSLPSAPSAIVYRVYANKGGGDPIQYGCPIATVATLNYQTSALTYPGTWSFGVRALDVGSGIEERNVDAAVTIILDAGGNDITNQPSPPAGLRAFARAGGAIKVEWRYTATTPSRLPTGFHVYLLVPNGHMVPPTPVRRGPRPRWTGVAGGFLYQLAATVPYSSGLFNVFTCTLDGLNDGVSYTIGVRAYNATAEESNTNTVNVTADATGPAPVDSLAATATS